MGDPTCSADDRRRQDFLNRCSEVNTLLDEADRRYGAWLSSLAVAYRGAWMSHADFVKGITEHAKFVNEMILTAAVAFIPGGVGGLVGDTMKKLGGGVFVIDAYKDLVKGVLRKYAPAIGQAAPPAFPTDPMVWVNKVNERVKTEMAGLTSILRIWQAYANDKDEEFTQTFDPVKTMSDYLTVDPPDGAAQPLLTLLPVGPDIPLQTNFEASFLKSWIEKLAYTAFKSMHVLAWGGFLGGFRGSGGAKGKIIAYGRSLGVTDVEQRVNDSVNEGLQKYHDPWAGPMS